MKIVGPRAGGYTVTPKDIDADAKDLKEVVGRGKRND